MSIFIRKIIILESFQIQYRVTGRRHRRRVPTKQSHNTHGSQESVTVKYPYHPLFNQDVKIIGQRKQNDETYLIIEIPSGRQFIPAWMTQEAANCLPIVSSPTLKTKPLLDLSLFLKPIILSLSGTQCTPNSGVIDANRNKPPT